MQKKKKWSAQRQIKLSTPTAYGTKPIVGLACTPVARSRVKLMTGTTGAAAGQGLFSSKFFFQNDHCSIFIYIL